MQFYAGGDWIVTVLFLPFSLLGFWDGLLARDGAGAGLLSAMRFTKGWHRPPEVDLHQTVLALRAANARRILLVLHVDLAS